MLIVSLAGISVTVLNASPYDSVPLLEVSELPSVQSSPSATPIDFMQIITLLDQRRREAFEKKDVIGLASVNHAGSSQAMLDENMLKHIIENNLSIEFLNADIISVLPLSALSEFTNDVMLEVRDSVNGEERRWNVTLVRQEDGSWRFSLVTRVPL